MVYSHAVAFLVLAIALFPLRNPGPPIVEFIGPELVDQFRITSAEIWDAGGSIQAVMETESDAMVLTRIAMGEAPSSFDDRVWVMWSIKLRAELGYKRAGYYSGYRTLHGRWGPPTSIKHEALCNGGCQYAPVEATFGVYFPLSLSGHLRAMVSPTDEQLPDFYLTWLVAQEIVSLGLWQMPPAMRGYDNFRSPTVGWVGTIRRPGGAPSIRPFPAGNIWYDDEEADNIWWSMYYTSTKVTLSSRSRGLRRLPERLQ